MPSVCASDGSSNAPRPNRRHGAGGGGSGDEVGQLGARPFVDAERLFLRERAHRVDEPAAGTDRVGRGREQHALQRGEIAHVGRFDAPAGVGPAPEHAEPAARRVEEDPVERARRAPRGDGRRRRSSRWHRARRCVRRRAIRVRTRPGCRSAATTRPSAPMRSAAAVALPPGADARSRMRSPGCGIEDADDRLARLVLRGRPPLGDRGQRREVARVPHEQCARRQRARLDLDAGRAQLGGHRLDRGSQRVHAQRDGRRLVVELERGDRVGDAERLEEGAHDPVGVRRAAPRPTRRRRRRGAGTADPSAPTSAARR